MQYEVLYVCVVSLLKCFCFIFPREQLGTVERSRQKYKAAPLTVEFVPFFYRKCFILRLSHTLRFFLYWQHRTGGLVWGRGCDRFPVPKKQTPTEHYDIVRTLHLLLQ